VKDDFPVFLFVVIFIGMIALGCIALLSKSSRNSQENTTKPSQVSEQPMQVPATKALTEEQESP
jgi:hypothetical protein